MPEALRRAGARTFVLGVIAPALVVLLMSACGDDDSSGDSDMDLAGTAWILGSVSIDGDDTAAVAMATLAFGADGETLAGSTGCNQFAGGFTQDGGDLTISVGPVTRAACGDPAATAQETAILARLPEVASFSSSGDQLVLESSDGDTLLTYDAGMSTIEGTSWTATGVNNGRGGVESSAASEAITAEFGSEGALSGFGGCNNYNGTYALSDGGGIAITNVASTLMACEEPAMTVETQYLTALQNVATYELSGDTLTLRDSSGAAQVTYTLAA